MINYKFTLLPPTSEKENTAVYHLTPRALKRAIMRNHATKEIMIEAMNGCGSKEHPEYPKWAGKKKFQQYRLYFVEMSNGNNSEYLGWTGFVQIDIDGFKTTKEATETARALQKSKAFFFAGLSSSTFGVKVIASVDLDMSRALSTANLTSAIKGFMDANFDLPLHTKIDSLSINTACYLPYTSKDASFNTEALPLPLSHYYTAPAPRKTTRVKQYAPTMRSEGTLTDKALLHAFNIGRKVYGGNYEASTHQAYRAYAWACIAFGIDSSTAWEFLSRRITPNIDPKEFSRFWKSGTARAKYGTDRTYF
jgi:hypothetical protein